MRLVPPIAIAQCFRCVWLCSVSVNGHSMKQYPHFKHTGGLLVDSGEKPGSNHLCVTTSHPGVKVQPLQPYQSLFIVHLNERLLSLGHAGATPVLFQVTTWTVIRFKYKSFIVVSVLLGLGVLLFCSCFLMWSFWLRSEVAKERERKARDQKQNLLYESSESFCCRCLCGVW